MHLAVGLALLAAIFVPLERLWALRPSALLRRDVWQDLGFYFLSSLLPGLLLSMPLSMMAAAGHAAMPHTFLAFMTSLPLWARVTIGLVVAEIGAYWGHRWSHERPLLWRFHAVHHQAEHMDWLVNTRAHPIDMVFTRLCALTPLYTLGLAGPAGAQGSTVAALVLVIGAMWGFFIHANLRWRFGPLEHFIATPAFHHWHHTVEGPLDRNYSAMMPWLDRLFGTLNLPPTWPQGYGVAEVPADQVIKPIGMLGSIAQSGGQQSSVFKAHGQERMVK